MPNDINKKQEQQFLNQGLETKKEDINSKIETPNSAEQREGLEEKKTEEINEVKEDQKEGELGQGSIIATSDKRQTQSERQKAIEKILENDMDDIYIGMRDDERIVFKSLGEKTVGQINQMIEDGKLKFKKVIELIKKWLLVVSGMNRFFLEQEAKLKTDEIMKLAVDKDGF